MGAMYKAGRAAYPMHSSNYFARVQMETLAAIGSVEALFIGEIVYKARAPTDGNHELNERYQQGGRYWTGDLLDYYHVGIVTVLNPLVITHCTRDVTVGIDGVTTDSRLGKWAWGGRLKGVNYQQGVISMASLYDAKVVTTGGVLNIRSTTSKSGTILGKAPNGELLQVLEETSNDWAKVYWEGVEGYAMRSYLSRIGGTEATDGSGVIVTLTDAEADAIKSIYAKL